MTVNEFYKNLFGCKVYKISLDAGCTCPNRDGTKGRGGCIFCNQNGSGDFLPQKNLSIKNQVEKAKLLIHSKNKKGKFIAYFQNFTNTYGNLDSLSKKWKETLSCADVLGLALGTRADCINENVCRVLKDFSEKYFVQVELGLQTSDEKTGILINRKYTNEDYLNAVFLLKKICPKVHIVTHLIFGLPFESEKTMLNSVDFVVNAKSDGIKICVLYVLKHTIIEEMFKNGEFNVLQMEEYFSILEKALKRIPENMVLHRLTGDGPKNQTIAPLWIFDKKKVLTKVNEILKKI